VSLWPAWSEWALPQQWSFSPGFGSALLRPYPQGDVACALPTTSHCIVSVLARLMPSLPSSFAKADRICLREIDNPPRELVEAALRMRAERLHTVGQGPSPTPAPRRRRARRPGDDSSSSDEDSETSGRRGATNAGTPGSTNQSTARIIGGQASFPRTNDPVVKLAIVWRAFVCVGGRRCITFSPESPFLLSYSFLVACAPQRPQKGRPGRGACCQPRVA